MILLIDNFDSFSYNLYQQIGKFDDDIKVIRNNEMTAAEIEKLNPEFIVISPGPKTPSQAGECINIIKELGSKISILGVCLGHQSIVEAYGGKVSNAKRLVHGKADNIKIDTSHPMFKDMDSIIKVARYHSLSAVEESLPDTDGRGASQGYTPRPASARGKRFQEYLLPAFVFRLPLFCLVYD